MSCIELQHWSVPLLVPVLQEPSARTMVAKAERTKSLAIMIEGDEGRKKERVLESGGQGFFYIPPPRVSKIDS
jgi:hypothetical protein